MAQSRSSLSDALNASAEYPALQDTVRLLFEAFHKNMWHEVTLHAFELFHNTSFLAQNGERVHHLVLYPKAEFFNPISYARLSLMIALTFSPETRCSFLKNVVSKDFEAQKCIQAEFSIATHACNNSYLLLDAACREIEDYTRPLDRVRVSPLLWMQYYRMRCVAHWFRQEWEFFYTCVFQYLAYCDTNVTLEPNDFSGLCVQVAISALLCPQLHNFGELLSNVRVSEGLKDTAPWLSTILQSFQEGDVESWKNLKTKYSLEISHNDLIRIHSEGLEQKFTLMSLLHYIFYTPENKGRILTFSQIAQRCEINATDVESLLISALSLDLFEGRMDGIARTLTVTLIKPRVLHPQEIGVFAKKAESWVDRIQQANSFLHREWNQQIGIFS